MTAATPAQLGVIARILGDAGATKPVRLDIVGGLVGRDLESTKELTSAEARSVLVYLGKCAEVGEVGLLVEQYRPAVTQ